MELKNKKILVTGGAGFIGSHIVDKLIDLGAKVTVVDNLSSGQRSYIDAKANFYLCDIRSDLLAKIFEVENPDFVFHLAAQMSVPYSVENPKYDLDVNLMGLINILQCCISFSVSKLVFSSSGGAIYGEAEEYPTSESYVPIPLSPYAITKFCSEKYIHFYSSKFGLDYTILRYANVYGPRQISAHESGVVTIFVQAVLNDSPVRIYTHPFQEHGMERDYIFVDDIVNANIAALEQNKNDIFNIGTGIPTTTYHLFDTIQKSASKNIKYSFHSPREGDIPRNCLNIEKAKKYLQWEPKVNLTEGLLKTLDYFKYLKK